MLVHEVAEAVGGVLVASVRSQQVVEVGQHVLDPLHRLRVVARQRLLHPLELRADDLALQHPGDLVVGGLGLGGVPLVAAQRAHCAGDVVGDRREVHLGEPGVVALLAGQLVALHRECLVEHRPDLVEGAAEVTASAGGLAQAAHPVGEVVEPPPAVEPAAHELRAATRAGCRRP